LNINLLMMSFWLVDIRSGKGNRVLNIGKKGGRRYKTTRFIPIAGQLFSKIGCSRDTYYRLKNAGAKNLQSSDINNKTSCIDFLKYAVENNMLGKRKLHQNYGKPISVSTIGYLLKRFRLNTVNDRLLAKYLTSGCSSYDLKKVKKIVKQKIKAGSLMHGDSKGILINDQTVWVFVPKQIIFLSIREKKISDNNYYNEICIYEGFSQYTICRLNIVTHQGVSINLAPIIKLIEHIVPKTSWFSWEIIVNGDAEYSRKDIKQRFEKFNRVSFKEHKIDILEILDSQFYHNLNILFEGIEKPSEIEIAGLLNRFIEHRNKSIIFKPYHYWRSPEEVFIRNQTLYTQF
jgi:hypothetical protein